jgi:hypothetical protein
MIEIAAVRSHDGARLLNRPPVRWHLKPCCVIAAWNEHRTQREISKVVERKRDSVEWRAAA